MMEAQNDGKKKETLRIGEVTLLLLAVFSIGEFFIGQIAIGWLAPLFIIAIIKASLILRDYMHISRLFAEDEEVHL
jgi:hypothetical protein